MQDEIVRESKGIELVREHIVYFPISHTHDICGIQMQNEEVETDSGMFKRDRYVCVR